MSSGTTLLAPSHAEIMASARNSLSGNWGLAIAAYIIMAVISGAAGIIPFGGLIVGGPFAVGMAIFFLNLIRGTGPSINNIFDGFKNFVNAFVAYLLMVIAIMVGMILLIVPGIIAAFGLSQTMYIVAENPQMSGVDALKKSWALMDGRKMDLFVLGLRFFPYILLAMVPVIIGAAMENMAIMGIGGLIAFAVMLWLAPYMGATFAKYYDTISGGVTEESEDEIIKHLVD